MNILDAAAVDDFAFLPGDPKKVAETKVTSHESRLVTTHEKSDEADFLVLKTSAFRDFLSVHREPL